MEREIYMLLALASLYIASPAQLSLQSSHLPPSSSASPCFTSCLCEEKHQDVDNFTTIRCFVNDEFSAHVNDFNTFLYYKRLKEKKTAYIHIETDAQRVPHFLCQIPSIHFLSLADNKLSVVQNKALSGMRLRELSLRNNQIREIGEEALSDLTYLQHLDLSRNRLSSIPKLVFVDLPNLRVLNLDHNELIYFPLDKLSHVPMLQELRLSFNRLTYVAPGALLSLTSLRLLDLHNNSLWTVASSLKQEAPSLEILDVSYNPFHCSCSVGPLAGLFSSSSSSFPSSSSYSSSSSSSSSLPQPDTPATITPNLQSPSSAQLSKTGTLSHLNTTTSSSSSSSSSHPLITTTTIITTTSPPPLLHPPPLLQLLHPDSIRCFTPLSVRGRPVASVLPELTACKAPQSVRSVDAHDFLYMDEVRLSCDVQGDPDPAIVWMTSWGHLFADPSYLPRLESVCSTSSSSSSSCRQEEKTGGNSSLDLSSDGEGVDRPAPCRKCHQQGSYLSPAIGIDSSTVSVTRRGRSLEMRHFRGMFRGNITCVAFNHLGSDTTTHSITVHCGIPGTFVDSLFIGAFCATGCLCFGLLVGSVKLLVLACRARFGKRRKVLRTPTTTALLSSIEEVEEEEDEDEEEEEGSCSYGHGAAWEGLNFHFRPFHHHSPGVNLGDDYFTPPGSPEFVSAVPSPPKALTPNEGQGSPTNQLRQPSILETMEEVRWRLKHGVGRGVQSVKRNVRSIKRSSQRNVQHIRESGSVYMQSIRETGSTAANKVKAGVVMGMVTVRSHVQSFRELCGTGGTMGDHTVSVISFQTDLDTNETTQLVKSVTEV